MYWNIHFFRIPAPNCFDLVAGFFREKKKTSQIDCCRVSHLRILNKVYTHTHTHTHVNLDCSNQNNCLDKICFL